MEYTANASRNFSTYRCLDPIKTQTTTPWYPTENTCPCDASNTNVTGRGFTPCPFGMDVETRNTVNLNIGNLPKQKKALIGTMYQNNQFVPPQLEPRPMSRIGNQNRNSM